jgi:putative FmdB family regulatory protein
MPIYPYACSCGQKFERFLTVLSNVRYQACPACGKPASQDYAAKMVTKPIIDNGDSGYYPPEFGFPKDPTNPMKSIRPAGSKGVDAMKRSEDRTEGAVGWTKV